MKVIILNLILGLLTAMGSTGQTQYESGMNKACKIGKSCTNLERSLETIATKEKPALTAPSGEETGPWDLLKIPVEGNNLGNKGD